MAKKINTKDLIFQCILDKQEQLSSYGVKNIGLFGSFIRGDQTTLRKSMGVRPTQLTTMPF
jgi:predicted nucleotidyltransferase